jgi:hypothetical protein
VKKYTLLEMTQKILSSLDGDEVNSINDTVESQQVVEIIESVYNDLMTRMDLPEHYKMVNLQGLGDITRPVVMEVPDTVDEVLWIKYNKVEVGGSEPVWDEVVYLTQAEFSDHVLSFNTSHPNVISYYPNATSDVQFMAENNRAPQYYTSLDDDRICFDAYNSNLENTLQVSKTQAYCLTKKSFTKTDGFIPALDANGFSFLLNEAKATAFAEMKQISNAMAEKNARRGMIHLTKNKQNVKGLPFFYSTPNFGRK